MKLFIHLLAAFWAILLSVFSQTPMPAQPATPTISAEIQRAINLLSGAGWTDAQKLAAERDTLATALPDILAADARMADLIAEKASGSDLLMQAIYQGLVAASDRGTDCKDMLPKFFEKVSQSNDPADLPDRSRFWMMRDTMLRNLAIRIVRAVEHRELSADEIAMIADNPSKWINRFSSSKSDGAASSEPIKNDARTAPHQAAAHENVVQPSSPKKTPEAKPAPTPSEEPDSSTPWSIIVVLIVAGLGLLWLLLKRRS